MKSGGEFVVREDRAPFAGLDVRGEDDAAPLVAAGDDLVEESGAVDVEGHVAELVEDDQVGSGEVLEEIVEGAVAFGLAELEDQFGGLAEAHASASLYGLHAERGRQVGLASSRFAVEHEVLGLVHEVEGEEPFPVVSVGQAHVREIVAVEAFGHGEPGLAHEPGAFGRFPVGELGGEHAVYRVQLTGRGPFERLLDGGLGDEQSACPFPQQVDVGFLVHAFSWV